jgi:hypothetical protein
MVILKFSPFRVQTIVASYPTQTPLPSNLGCDRKIFEVGQVPPSRASLHPSQLVLGLALGGDILGVDRLFLNNIRIGEN